MRYRYEEQIYDSGVKLNLREFNELKKTKCGSWVIEACWWPGKKRFVLDGIGKRYCHETKEMAFDSYIMRKKSQLRHAQNALDISKFMIAETEKLTEAPNETIDLGRPKFWENYHFD